MNRATKRIAGVAGVSISALAVLNNIGVAANGPQTHVNGDYAQGTDFLKITYKLGEADSAVAWLKAAGDGVDITLKFGSQVDHKHIAGIKYSDATTDAYYKFVKHTGADFFIKFSSGQALDLLFHKLKDGSVDVTLAGEEQPGPVVTEGPIG